MRPLEHLSFWWVLLQLAAGILTLGLVALLSLRLLRPGILLQGSVPNSALHSDSLNLSSNWGSTDSLLQNWGFTCLNDYDTLLCIDLRYASTNTFAKRPFYATLNQAWLHPLAAAKLVKAAQLLRQEHDSLRLLVYDAARPLKAQFDLYMTACSLDAGRYVAVPWGGSVHNYGFAVDVGLANAKCYELDLGTPYDSFDSLAQPRYEYFFLRSGRLDSVAWQRRKLLRKVMRAAGFRRIDLEWWHFEAAPIDTVRVRFRIIP